MIQIRNESVQLSKFGDSVSGDPFGFSFLRQRQRSTDRDHRTAQIYNWWIWKSIRRKAIVNYVWFHWTSQYLMVKNVSRSNIRSWTERERIRQCVVTTLTASVHGWCGRRSTGTVQRSIRTPPQREGWRNWKWDRTEYVETCWHKHDDDTSV